MSDELDVLIVHHHTRDPVRPLTYAAMGLLSLADYLARDGIRVQVVNLAVEERIDPGFDVVAHCASCGVRIVGISLHWFFQLHAALSLAEEVKQRCPGAHVVMGGFTASYFARDLLQRTPSIDAVIRGDGEVPFLLLCRALLAGQPPGDGIPNLARRDDRGQPRLNPISHVATSAELGDYRFANLRLLKNHDAALRTGHRGTNLHYERFRFDTDGVFILEPGRGCNYQCSLCGGAWEAQRLCFNRARAVFRPVDAMIATIRAAMSHGCRNFYTSFDPDPSGHYYLELFDRIRRLALPIRFLFESWILPSEELIHAMADSFEDGMIVITADSADETVRRRHKGILWFSNDELLARLSLIRERGLASQLFFGFFLPSDTRETMMRTRRFAHDVQDRLGCEAIYMAFSTDPGCQVVLHPQQYDMHVDVGSLDSYLSELSASRLSPNMLAHRPARMSQAEARSLTVALNLDHLVQKVLPIGLRLLYCWACGDRAEVHHLFEEFLLSSSPGSQENQQGFEMSRVTGMLLQSIRSRPQLLGDRCDALCDLICYEAAPYVQMEQNFGPLGVHFAKICREEAIDDATRKQVLDRGEGIQCVLCLDHDIKSAFPDLRQGSTAVPRRVRSRVLLFLDRRGRYQFRNAE